MPIDYTKRPETPPPSEPPAPPPSAPLPPPTAPPPPAAPSANPVSLNKVTLTKSAPSVSLTKHGGATGTLRVNLNWNAKPPERGFFKKQFQLDLDLGCLYEFSDGTKGVVQALGNAFTATNR